jgi:DedD protein
MEDKLEKLKKKNDLSDIILEKDNPSSGDKLKKILLGAASLVLLALIVLIGMKMFNSSNVSPSESLANIGDNIEQSGENLVDGAVDAMDGAKGAVEDATDSSLFKKEAIIDENSETDQKFEEMVRKLKQQDAADTLKDENSVDDALEKITDKPKDLVASAKDSVVNKIKEITPEPAKIKESVESITPKVIATSKPIQEVATPVRRVVQPEEILQAPIIQSQPVTRREVVQAKPKRTYTAPSSNISSISGYFIQVGATSKSFPDKRFLQKIKNSGYDYIVHKVNVKGRNITKVLVGPYNSRSEARNELSGVQSSLNPSAYIYRVK